METTTNLGLKMPAGEEFYNVQHINDNMKVIDEKMTDIEKSAEKTGTDISEHMDNLENPHKVTAKQVGLGNVPNVSTNNQTPTYTVASANAALSSGEKLSVAMGKIAKAISSLISHLSNESNPHKVTAEQIGAIDTLITMEEINASTDLKKPVGAGAVKELNSNFIKYKIIKYENITIPHNYNSRYQSDIITTESILQKAGLDGAILKTLQVLCVELENGDSTDDSYGKVLCNSNMNIVGFVINASHNYACNVYIQIGYVELD